jgi:acetyltransferase
VRWQRLVAVCFFNPNHKTSLLEGGFRGAVLPVNPKHEAVAGVLCYPDIASLPVPPELAVVCTPPAAVPDTIAQLARRGAKAAVVLTAGLTRPQHLAMLANARAGAMRILGPNCVGLVASPAHLNASFGHMAALPGRTAFVSQSGALGTAILDWARARNVGFSAFVSLGDGGDVSFADTLAYLAEDPHTSAILLYIESVTVGCTLFFR